MYRFLTFQIPVVAILLCIWGPTIYIPSACCSFSRQKSSLRVVTFLWLCTVSEGVGRKGRNVYVQNSKTAKRSRQKKSRKKISWRIASQSLQLRIEESVFRDPNEKRYGRKDLLGIIVHWRWMKNKFISKNKCWSFLSFWKISHRSYKQQFSAWFEVNLQISQFYTLLVYEKTKII